MWIVLCDVLVAGVMIEFLICINQFLTIQWLSSTTLLATWPGTMWKGARFSQFLEMRGVTFTFLMIIFLVRLFSQKDKLETLISQKDKLETLFSKKDKLETLFSQKDKLEVKISVGS
jgi:hypothetical protein